jgi:ATP-dependent helicase HrpA
LRRALRDWPADLVLPVTEEIRAADSLPVILYPGLALGENALEVRRFPTLEEAWLSHRSAVGHLLSWTADGTDHLLAWLPRDVKLPQDVLLPLAAWTDPRLFHQGLCEALRAWALSAGRMAPITRPGNSGPRDIAGFTKALEEARRRIRHGRGEAVTLVKALVAARTAFEDEARRIPAHRPDLVKFAALTRERLWPSGFPASMAWETLSRMPTWWRTAARRIASAKDNPTRDQQRVAELAPFAKALALKAGSQPPVPRVPGTLADPDGLETLGELAFLLEEFRVQLWAQELGTIVPASPKRIGEAFATLM